MQEIAELAVSTAIGAGASYADCRFVHRHQQTIIVKNGGVDQLTSSDTAGIGVRVIANGAWGFASTFDLSENSVRNTALEAVEIARASATTCPEPVQLAEVQPIRAEVPSSARVDPFQIPLQEKIDLLMACDAAMAIPGIVVRISHFHCSHEEKFFASSEGARIYQARTVTGAGIQAMAAEAGETQRRSFPSSHGFGIAARGWEQVEELGLLENAPRIAREAVELLKADPCPDGYADIIIEGSQLALQLHESCGHPIELDRVLGTEASFAGTSFLTLDKLGKFRYGSDIVNIYADATIPHALGSFTYDDEGVPAQRFDIVRDGIFVGYLTSRETAARLGQSSNGCMRADGWNRLPLIRMTNINLAPGDAGSLQELIRDIDEGLLMDTNRSWSIDDKRLNFQFGCEIAWRIKGGEIVGPVRNPSYQGITPEFWASCDAICSESEWQMWGIPNCGKGEPIQIMQVGHGVAPARFRKVRVMPA